MITAKSADFTSLAGLPKPFSCCKRVAVIAGSCAHELCKLLHCDPFHLVDYFLGNWVYQQAVSFLGASYCKGDL